MKHVKLFEQFITETVELKNAYPFEFSSVKKGGDVIHSIKYHFKTENETTYSFEMVRHIDSEKDFRIYEVGFYSNAGSYADLTNERNALRVFATVAKILITILTRYKNELERIPILIKGSPKPIKRFSDWDAKENERDRIYKNIAKRYLHQVPGYEFVDLGTKGFELRPIKNEIR